MNLHLDFETFSYTDLKTAGIYKYVRDPGFDVYCLGYAFEDDPVQLWSPLTHDCMIPEPLAWACENPSVVFYAFNAEFEATVWYECMHLIYGWPNIPLDRWRCVQAMAAYHGLPRKLDLVSKRLELSERKDNEGNRLMKKLSIPDNKGHRVLDLKAFEKVGDYCKQDVRTERCIAHELSFNLPKPIHEQWCLNTIVNRIGIPVDRQFCEGALRVLGPIRSRLAGRIYSLTGNVTSPKQNVRILEHLIQSGLVVDNLREDTVRDTLARDDLTDFQRSLLELRSLGSNAAYTKYPAALASMCEDDRARNQFKFYEAITGRFAGRGVQPQNLKRGEFDQQLYDMICAGDTEAVRAGYKRPIEAVSKMVRAIIRAPKDHSFIISDLSQIELRVCAWLADDKPLLKELASGMDLYIPLAAQIYGVAAESLDKKSPERQMGKKIRLGSIFKQGWRKLQAAVQKDTGIVLDETFCRNAIDVARASMPGIVGYWRELDKARDLCLRTEQDVWARKIKFEWLGEWMTMCLPSGRKLYYHRPYWDKDGGYDGRGEWMYMGPRGPATLRVTVLIENITQAAACDILMEATMRIYAKGLELCGTEHDKVLVLCYNEDIGRISDIVTSCMQERPRWCQDLYISTETKVKQMFF